MKKVLFAAGILAAFTTNVLADQTVIKEREGRSADTVHVGVPGPDVTVKGTDCDSKTVHKEDGMGDSKTVHKSNC